MIGIYIRLQNIKVIVLFLGILICGINDVGAQIKIGDNPSVIDPGSVLELESTDLVLVITRVNTQQMNALSPMAGALVYNTELGCVHSFNGVNWVNLCNDSEAGAVSTTPGNVLSNVGGAYYNDQGIRNQIINAEAILDGHILADEDINAQNELSNLALNGNVITLTNPLDSANQIDLTPILGNGSAAINEAFEVVNGNLNISDSGGTLSVPLSALGTENVTNELIVDGAVIGTDLIINEGVNNQVTIDVTSLVGGGTGIANESFEVANGNLNITDSGGTLSVPLNALGTENITNELIVDGAVVGTDLIINEGTNNQVTIDVTSLVGGGTGIANESFEVANGNLNITDSGGTLSVPLNALGTENITNELIVDGAVVGTDLIINEGTNNQVTIDVTSLLNTDTGSDNTAFLVANGNLSITDGAGTISVPLTDLSAATSSNLGNTNLTQTGGNRTYNLNNQNLAFTGTGNIGIGTALPQAKLHVGESLRVNGNYIDSTGDVGNVGEVLSSTGTGTNWIPASVASSPYHAVGKMSEGSITKGFNVFAVSDLGIGQYRILFGSPASSADYVVQLTLLNSGPGSIEVIAQSANAFTVQIYGITGAVKDGDWYFTIIDF